MRLASLLLWPLLMAALTGAEVLAQDVFTVEGKVKQSACTPNLQQQLVPGTDNTANTVSLPKVSNHLLKTQGQRAGYTDITFRASGCSGNHNNMWVHFTSSNSVDGNGRIIPSGTDKVRFEFRNNNASGSLVRVGGSAGNAPDSNQGTTVPFSGSQTDSNRVANKTYNIHYYAHEGVNYSGSVSASVTANFKYN